MNHQAIIQLIIAYTLVGAFLFTVVITCLSLVGWIKLANSAQQQKLFSVLVVELVVGCLAFFFNFLTLNPTLAVKNIGDQAVVIHQKRIESLLTRIDALPPNKALQAETKASNLSSAQVNAAVEARDPAKLRERDPAAAKAILKMRLVLGDRSPSDIDAWEKIINEPQ